MAEHNKQPRETLNEETRAFDTSDVLGFPGPKPDPNSESLFETYDRRSLKSIITAQKAYKESQAAQAARTILEGADLPEFEHTEYATAEYEELENASSHAPRVIRLRVHRTSALGVLATPGAQIVYALLTVAALGGTLALALSTNSPELLLIGGVATPMLLPICVWRWFRWLDSSPYYYRLLTSLGEDARNLLQYRLLWKKAKPN